MGIYRELRAQGYQGSYGAVYAQLNSSSRKAHSKQPSTSSPSLSLPSSRQATWVFLRRPEELTAREQETLTRLRQLYPDVDLAYTFVQQFAQMLRMRTGEQLDAWLDAVASSPLADLQSFVGSVSEDKEAILAGLTREESNGPTEGHITRLKLIKRSMYGRAKFDLLRLRVLFRPQQSHKATDAKRKVPHKQRQRRDNKLRVGEKTSTSQRTTFRVSEAA